MDKIKEKLLNREVIMYVIFGIATTLVNLIVSFILEGIVNLNGEIASAIGIIASILFAYFTNRKWVFQTKAKGKENIKEFGKFILGRAFTMIVEQGGVIIFYTHMNLPFMPVKLSLTIVVIILNFFLSKFFAFKK
ncbi:MAG: GtrA family protein [Clostridia bacterium]